MQSYSIDIFNDSVETSQKTTDPLLTFRPESTSLNAPELLPLNNSPDTRFEQNRLLNGKTKYEETNTIIKSLEEEIVTMKHKLSFVYEKDEEIAKLKDELNTLKKENTELQNDLDGNVKLKIENSRLSDELQLIKEKLNHYEKLSKENKLLKQKLKMRTSKFDKKVIEDIQQIEDISISDDDDDIDIVEPVDEMINIDIRHLRQVLLTRLKSKQIEHIESLITIYGLKRKNQVKRSVMERMLEEAIHM